VRVELPAPTGPRALGTLELHLVDHSRTDPWAARPDQPREVMVSIWYPAEPSPDLPAAPYLEAGPAAFYDQEIGSLGVPGGSVDFAGIRTHARVGAPAAPGATGLPVLLYSPGGGQSRAMGTTLVEELASRGYVVVTVDHTFAGPVQLPDRMEPPIHGMDLARMMRERTIDTSFVLDQLALLQAGTQPDAGALPPGLGAALDLSRVGMFGHSAGGFTAAEAMIVDDRIDAGANLDGSMEPGYGQAADRGVDRPFLLIGGGTSGNDAHPHNHGHAPDWASFWEHSTGWKRDLYLPAAEHMGFSDQQVLLPEIGQELPLPDEALEATIGTIDPQRSLAVQRAYLSAFFDQHLLGRPTTLFDAVPAEYPDAQLVP
jgi:hypothetical protein